MKVLAIESTCDETAAAVVEGGERGIRVITNIVASSADIHTKYGGVVPEVAAREQIKSIVPVLTEALNGTEMKDVDAIAVAYGPGLIGSLLVGIETARALALAWNKPLIRVNHIEAHVAANWILSEVRKTTPKLPAIGLIISGGHTDIVLVEDYKHWKWIGGTVDDAAGEAFDKVARILRLPYPGGPSIQKAAEIVDETFEVSKLPRPMIHEHNLKMSFSGLKAAVAKVVGKELNPDQVNGVAREFNEAVAEVLARKTAEAIDVHQPRTFLVAGGVAANKMIREKLQEMALSKGLDIFLPELRYCGDNAAMVGAAAILNPDYIEIENLGPEPSLML